MLAHPVESVLQLLELVAEGDEEQTLVLRLAERHALPIPEMTTQDQKS